MTLSEMSCSLCKRNNLSRRENQPPPMQRAHFLANRLTGHERRYKGARNVFTEQEWHTIINRLRQEFNLPADISLAQAKKTLSTIWLPLCAECHQEVLAEPFYLPSFIEALSPYFIGKSRIEKILTLMQILQLGIKEFQRSGQGS